MGKKAGSQKFQSLSNRIAESVSDASAFVDALLVIAFEPAGGGALLVFRKARCVKQSKKNCKVGEQAICEDAIEIEL